MWIINSSEDPKKWSKTVQGIGVGVVAVLPIVGLDSSGWSDVFQNLANFAEALAFVVATWMTFTGAVRKVKITKLGKNETWNDPIWR